MKGWSKGWLATSLFMFSGLLGLNPAAFVVSRSSWYWPAAAGGGCLVSTLLFWLSDYASLKLWALVALGVVFIAFHAVSAGVGEAFAIVGVGAFLYGVVPPLYPLLIGVSSGAARGSIPLFIATAFVVSVQITAFAELGDLWNAAHSVGSAAGAGSGDSQNPGNQGNAGGNTAQEYSPYLVYSICASIIAVLFLVCLGMSFVPVKRGWAKIPRRKSLFRGSMARSHSREVPSSRAAPSDPSVAYNLPKDEPPGSYFCQPQFPRAFNIPAQDKTVQTEAVYRAVYAGKTSSGAIYYRAVEEVNPVHFPSGMKVLSALESAAHLSDLARSSTWSSAWSSSAPETAWAQQGPPSGGGLPDSSSAMQVATRTLSESLSTTSPIPRVLNVSVGQLRPGEPRGAPRKPHIPRSYRIPPALDAVRLSPIAILSGNLKNLTQRGTTHPVVVFLLMAVSEFLHIFLLAFCQSSLWEQTRDLHTSLVYICPVISSLAALALSGLVAAIPKLSVKAAMGWAFTLHASAGVCLAGTGMGVAAVVLATAAMACGGAGLVLSLVSGAAMLCRRPGFNARGAVGMMTSGYSLVRTLAVVFGPVSVTASRLAASLTILVIGGAAALATLTTTRAITDYSAKRVCQACQTSFGGLGNLDKLGNLSNQTSQNDQTACKGACAGPAAGGGKRAEY